MGEISYEEASRLRKKYPQRAPILVKTKGDIDLDRSKYLVPTKWRRVCRNCHF